VSHRAPRRKALTKSVNHGSGVLIVHLPRCRVTQIIIGFKCEWDALGKNKPDVPSD
jgi:hypothetical protein